MAMQIYTCDVRILGKGPLKGVELWLCSASQVEAKKAEQDKFPGQNIIGVANVTRKK